MKSYEITVDGFFVGIVELTRDDVRALESDSDIILKEVKNDQY